VVRFAACLEFPFFLFFDLPFGARSLLP